MGDRAAAAPSITGPPSDPRAPAASHRPWRSWFVAVGLVYLGVLAVNRSLVAVRGPSMEPALWPGDQLLTLPAPSWALRPGQVVVVRDPADRSHLVVKRVAEVGGGTVDVRGDAPERSTDSRAWGRLPTAAVRRVAVARWPDLRTPLRYRAVDGR